MIYDSITHRGQSIYDKPIYDWINPKPIARMVASMFGKRMRPVRVLLGHERIILMWK